jgi:hypothetical protein
MAGSDTLEEAPTRQTPQVRSAPPDRQTATREAEPAVAVS